MLENPPKQNKWIPPSTIWYTALLSFSIFCLSILTGFSLLLSICLWICMYVWDSLAINICSYKYKRNVEVLAPTAGTIVLNLFIYWLQGQNRGRGHRYHAVCVCIFVCLWMVCLHRRMLSWVNKWHIDIMIEFLSGNAVLPDVKSVCFPLISAKCSKWK